MKYVTSKIVQTTRASKRGFTLVETLIAITVLVLVVIGPITIAQQGIKTARYASEEMTATFLAQEAIEGVRSFRDTKALEAIESGGSEGTWEWVDEVPNECAGSSGCAYDNRHDDGDGGSPLTRCPTAGDGECPLYITDEGEYSTNSGRGEEAIYRRKVFIEDVSTARLPNVVKVKVQVDWDSPAFGTGERSVVLQTYLYDHYERF